MKQTRLKNFNRQNSNESTAVSFDPKVIEISTHGTIEKPIKDAENHLHNSMSAKVRCVRISEDSMDTKRPEKLQAKSSYVSNESGISEESWSSLGSESLSAAQLRIRYAENYSSLKII